MDDSIRKKKNTSLTATAEFTLFDTVNRISLPERFRYLLPELVARCERFHALFSPTEPDSDVCRIGKSETVSVAPETAELLSLALRFGRETDGLFDISLGGATRLWDWKRRRTLPDRTELEAVVSSGSLDRIRVEGEFVRAPIGCRIDLGGIAKGFIADKLTDCLRREGVTCGVLDLGGNLSLLGTPEDRESWQIGLRDPERTDGGCFALLRCGALSVVTSAASERCAVIDGKRFHHLLDPKTGMPADSDLLSVTICCECSALADALATACFVGGRERAGALIERFAPEGVEAILLGTDRRCFVSAGLAETDAVRLLWGDRS